MDLYSPTRAGRCGTTRSPLILLLIVTLGFVVGAARVNAQMPKIPIVTQEELASHLMTYVAPTYPAAAQSAKVQGDVVIVVEIGPDGSIRAARAISGPPVLVQAAVSVLKRWRYMPFHSGKESIAVEGNVLVSFTLRDKPEVHTPHEASANGSYSVSLTLPPTDHRGEPDAEIAERFDIPWDTCTRGVIAHATDVDTANACKKAAAIADEFAADRRFVERRRAYVYAAMAYANIRDLPTALHYADKAVEVVKLGHDDYSGAEAAYSIRGQIRAFSGDMVGGDKDMSLAEDSCRKGKLSVALKRDLQFHAELLKRMNQPLEAQAKLDEAAKL